MHESNINAEELGNSDFHPSDGKERTIAMPGPDGGQILMSSKTMTPEYMKEFRDNVAKLQASRNSNR